MSKKFSMGGEAAFQSIIQKLFDMKDELENTDKEVCSTIDEELLDIGGFYERRKY